MKSNVLLKIANTQFDLSFSMLEKMIEKCPDDLWNEKKEDLSFGNNYYMLFLEQIIG